MNGETRPGPGSALDDGIVPRHPATRLRYEFDPVPKRARLALRDGLINRDDLAILTVLYGRADRDRLDLRDEADRRYFPTRATLDQLVEELNWDLSPDWLSKRLRELRADGWFDYRTSGQSHARYDFFLFPEPPEPVQSESSPSRDEPGSPSREDVLTTVMTGLERAGVLDESESPKGSNPEASPRRPLQSPSREETMKPLGQRDPAPPVRALSPSPPESQEKGSSGEGGTTALAEGEVLEGEESLREEARPVQSCSPRLGDRGYLGFLHDASRAGALTRSEWLGRVGLHGAVWRARPADEEAILTEVEELVAAGILRPEVEPCRHGAHRGSDWRNDAGRLVCGVCHPPVRRLRGAA